MSLPRALCCLCDDDAANSVNCPEPMLIQIVFKGTLTLSSPEGCDSRIIYVRSTIYTVKCYPFVSHDYYNVRKQPKNLTRRLHQAIFTLCDRALILQHLWSVNHFGKIPQDLPSHSLLPSNEDFYENKVGRIEPFLITRYAIKVTLL